MFHICSGSMTWIGVIAACLVSVGCDEAVTEDGAVGTGAPEPAGLFHGGGDPDVLIQWVREQGGEIHFEVGEVCKGCMRGMLATKDVKEGDLVAVIPTKTILDMGPEDYGLPEAGAAWIRRMHADPAYNATFRLYFDALPTTDEVLSPEMWTQDMVAALQSPELEHMVGQRITGAEQWWHYAGFADGAPGEDGLSIQLPVAAFQHAIACITTRTFGYPSPADNHTRHKWMVPAIDMANSAEKGLLGPDDIGASAHVMYPADDDAFKMFALRDIAKGEEVTLAYTHGYIHRPDLALMSYGFLPPREPPIMSAVDLPSGFGEVEQPLRGFPLTPLSEPDYGNVDGQWTTEAELQRLLRIQASLPTTLEDDIQLLEGTMQPALELVMQWRVARKRALLAAITQLSASLAAQHKAWPCNRNFRPPAPGSLTTEECSSAVGGEQTDDTPQQLLHSAAAGGGGSFGADGSTGDSGVLEHEEHEEL